ncbi:MAG: Crp/Fnr family transcriptional regulator [Acidobacteriota bacterium]|nr:Crp/Fnr family transcriptional regulator [Acidobacteriota bacterium]MDQ2978360.1 Crp/Fnr family transcriptional regulator [Acidobacteriota bacterium]
MAKKLSQNYLLAGLPPGEFRRLVPHLLPYTTKPGEELHQRTGSSLYVYFPINSVSSLVITLTDGSMVEAATVGNEGMVGLPLFVKSEAVSIQAFTHVGGNGLKMARSVLLVELKRERALCHRLHEYTEALLLFIAQSCACNQMHSQRQRCARWLLLIHDRVGDHTFSLTQEFLAQMLGVRRATVTVAAGALRAQKLIAYRKGVIQILNRKGLEEAACECYKTVGQEFERLKNTPSI